MFIMLKPIAGSACNGTCNNLTSNAFKAINGICTIVLGILPSTGDVTRLCRYEFEPENG